MSSSTFKGVLKRISAKSGTGKRGPWTAYSICVGPAGNDDNDTWFRYGFNAPNADEGSVVSFEFDEIDPNTRKVKGDLTVDKKATANVAKAASDVSNDPKQMSIIRQSATNGAIQIAATLVDKDMVKLPAKAKQYDFYLELVRNIADTLVPVYANPPSIDELVDDAIEEASDPEDEFVEDDPWSPVE